MPSVVPVHRLEVICSEHQHNKLKWRADFDALSQPDKTVPAAFEGIVPDGTPTVQTIFDDTNALTRGTEGDFHDARPALLEMQALSRRWGNVPGQRIRVNKDVLHGGSGVCARATNRITGLCRSFMHGNHFCSLSAHKKAP
jgi:hypothetical protein